MPSVDRRRRIKLMQRSSKLAERNRLEICFPGQMPEKDLDFLPEDTIIALVLSSLDLSLLTVVEVLTSLVLFCMERRPGVRWGAAYFWSWESHWRMSGEGQSAFQWQWKEKLCKEQRVQVQGQIPVEHRMRWELAHMCGSGYWQTECGLWCMIKTKQNKKPSSKAVLYIPKSRWSRWIICYSLSYWRLVSERRNSAIS